MRNTLPLLALLAIVALASGCSNVERKFGRGMMNAFDIARAGEFRRTMEQTALNSSPDTAYGAGFVRGINRTLARTGIGIYEMVSAPFPPYDPIFTDHFSPGPVYPDNYKPGLMADTLWATDTSVGFGGGDIAPFVPGSRFVIFEGP